MKTRMAVSILALFLLVAGCGVAPSQPGQTALDPRPSVPESTEKQNQDNQSDGSDKASEQNETKGTQPETSTKPSTTQQSCPTKDSYAEEEAEACIKDGAEAAIQALKAQDMKRLASLVHPKEGLRFGVEGRIQNSPTFSRAQVEKLLDDPTVYLWGYVGGKPSEVQETFREFYKSTIYHQDFANAPEVVYGRIHRAGNMDYSIPAGQIVAEYHFPGFNPEYGGLDWTSLRLYFKQSGDQWYLVSIIEDNWQI